MATGDEVQKPDASLYVRGSCTDQSWKDASCPLFCISSDDLRSGGMGIAKCPNTALDEYYCIDAGDSSVNCTAQFNVFEFPGNESSKPPTLYSALTRYAGTPSVLTTIGVIGAATITSTTSSSTTLMTATSTAPPPPPSSVDASSYTALMTTTLMTTTSTAVLPPLSSVAASSYTTSTAISAVAPPATSSSVPTSQPAPSSNSVAIGVGVAVPCCLIIAGLLGFICCRRQKGHGIPASDVKQSQSYVDVQPPTYYSGVTNQELDGNVTTHAGYMPITYRHELPSARQ